MLLERFGAGGAKAFAVNGAAGVPKPPAPCPKEDPAPAALPKLPNPVNPVAPLPTVPGGPIVDVGAALTHQTFLLLHLTPQTFLLLVSSARRHKY